MCFPLLSPSHGRGTADWFGVSKDSDSTQKWQRKSIRHCSQRYGKLKPQVIRELDLPSQDNASLTSTETPPPLYVGPCQLGMQKVCLPPAASQRPLTLLPGAGAGDTTHLNRGGSLKLMVWDGGWMVPLRHLRYFLGREAWGMGQLPGTVPWGQLWMGEHLRAKSSVKALQAGRGTPLGAVGWGVPTAVQAPTECGGSSSCVLHSRAGVGKEPLG